MLPSSIRILAIIVTLAAGVFLLFYQEWIWGGLAIGLTAYLAYVQFRLGPVVLGLRYLYRGNVAKCEREINKVKYPDKIPGKLQGYYYFCQGYIHHHHKRQAEAAAAFASALEKGLRMENDQAVAHVSIAHYEASQGKKAQANKHLKAAKELKHNEAVDSAIQQVEQQLR